MTSKELGEVPAEQMFFVTFGVKYRTEPHPKGAWITPDGYAMLVQNDEDSARSKANELFGEDGWSMIYDHLDVEFGRFNKDAYPAGAIAVFGLPSGDVIQHQGATEIEGYVEGSDVANWRVIDNIAYGTLTGTSDDGSIQQVLGCIQMETVDVDGENPMDVMFGVNPGAVQSFIGSLCLHYAPDKVTAHQWMEQILGILTSGDKELP